MRRGSTNHSSLPDWGQSAISQGPPAGTCLAYRAAKGRSPRARRAHRSQPGAKPRVRGGRGSIALSGRQKCSPSIPGKPLVKLNAILLANDRRISAIGPHRAKLQHGSCAGLAPVQGLDRAGDDHPGLRPGLRSVSPSGSGASPHLRCHTLNTYPREAGEGIRRLHLITS